jgi:tetratricopeptide (TPR) repeat protein
MKLWYELAYTALKAELNINKRVNGLEFLEDFVLDNRDTYFEGLEFDEVDCFVSEEFDTYQNWLTEEKSENVNIGTNGKWYSNTNEKKLSIQPEISFDLTADEAKLLELKALSLHSGKVQEFKALSQKLASTNFHELKFKCAFRLAKCAELNKNIPENELIVFWLNAADTAIRANLLADACECKSKASYHYLRISNHEEAAKSYEEAFNIVEKTEFNNKMQLLKNSRIQYQLFGDHDSASRIFYKEKKLEYCEASPWKKAALLLYYFTSNYGESPKRVLCNCVVVLLLSTLLAFGLEIAVRADEVSYSWSSLANSAYYSVVTFTTLGYGDFSPTTHWGQLFASVLAILGLIYTSLFMVAVVRKYSRS